ncbi:MAG: hypothetical protein NTY77_18210 [Elusimicrobia bacterium]|nr:hypothetical protein [Elusimicrobiota bacterium]
MVLLPLRPASGAGSFAAADLEQAQTIVGEMRTLSQVISSRPMPRDRAEEVQLGRCGPWGALCAQALAMARQKRAFANDTRPIGAGFKALGPAGKTGVIDGPGVQGNGTYRVVANEDYRLQIVVDTGYIAGEITLTRDPATGRATMRFAGRRWNDGQGAWGPAEDATKEVAIEYDAKRDLGYLRWVEDGEWKYERYWGGAQDAGMTIEFGGGWDHDFRQDK